MHRTGKQHLHRHNSCRAFRKEHLQQSQRILQVVCIKAGQLQESLEDVARKPSGGKLPTGQYSHASGYACVLDPRIGGNVGTNIDIDMPPDRHELFLLDDGEKKVEYEPETRKSQPYHIYLRMSH